MCKHLARQSVFTKLILADIIIDIYTSQDISTKIDRQHLFLFYCPCFWLLTDVMIFNSVYYKPDAKTRTVLDTWVVLISTVLTLNEKLRMGRFFCSLRTSHKENFSDIFVFFSCYVQVWEYWIRYTIVLMY